MEMEEEKKRRKRKSSSSSSSSSWSTESSSSSINNLDDGCLMHIFSFLSPIPDGNTWLVILDFGSVLIALSLILLIHTLESSPALRLLFLLLGLATPF
ncbi:hypothetical protein TIFTF001_033893 [Ficus carica]|uniref:Transmembrane protein n=1 Tax=Ficus carica TaxID=3494 RepID=A0AA88DZJ9_FICCA|nr:hypothetical protein TIFTF001_033893 [Ficus carica]